MYTLDEIGAQFEDAVEGWQHTTRNGFAIGAALDALFLFFDMRGRFTEGVAVLSRSVHDLAARFGEQHLDVLRCRARIAALIQRCGRFADARDMLRDTLAQLPAEHAAERAFVQYRLGDTARNLGDLGLAHQHLHAVHALYAALGDDHGAATKHHSCHSDNGGIRLSRSRLSTDSSLPRNDKRDDFDGALMYRSPLAVAFAYTATMGANIMDFDHGWERRRFQVQGCWVENSWSVIRFTGERNSG